MRNHEFLKYQEPLPIAYRHEPMGRLDKFFGWAADRLRWIALNIDSLRHLRTFENEIDHGCSKCSYLDKLKNFRATGLWSHT